MILTPRAKFRLFLFSVFVSFLACTNPLSPTYEFKEGMIYIDGFVGTTEGSSYVNITESDVALYYRNIFVSGAKVAFVNEITGERVALFEEDFRYIPEEINFKGNVGERWYLEASLPNGTTYLSEVETINPSVPIKSISAVFDNELEFSEDYDDYIPGHEVLISFDDPGNQDNYYYWRYKTYDQPSICQVCVEGRFRDGICIPDGTVEYYTYWCESDCWQIDYGDNINIFSDSFSNGTTTTSLPVAQVPLTRKTRVLVEIQQFSLTPKAYEYYRTIKDLVDNNGGFNAPLPAALIGNIYNPEDPDEYVLGRFTAASAFTESIMIDRTTVEASPIENQRTPKPEPPPTAGGPHFLYAPCNESRHRTSIRPEGWID
ncbi:MULTISPECIES: DUF4249 domain-containing protein [unclassified Leeuwenhoekiella]|uniref:DUF4249 domain-containing protein n=1 Tax=unclassified Leeuwenhoekiella TaxID=2615029 RepID=UPI000C5F41FB|nr:MULTISPECIES: DUF4249 domain-containing protein [unclassified Leeuwenhoekiella]MAW94785.1 hypothetical protein [Leeuwenhoekiella sp.]MBA79504.1 hypothetical protein [Leeuwenhoekiella sp.]|tara:strand:+ start:88407 stop:89528 length:1122 start_codon:yes stop_codon:yes gene_type:complete